MIGTAHKRGDIVSLPKVIISSAINLVADYHYYLHINRWLTSSHPSRLALFQHELQDS